ncbi:hypothetical protein JCM3775_002140 [Rhodotorula graminis]
MPHDRAYDPPPPFSPSPASPSTSVVSPGAPDPLASSMPALALSPTLPPDYSAPPVAEPHAVVPHAALVAHLSLLSHFFRLRDRVRSSTSGPLASLSPGARWSAFLRLAAYRLDVWLSRVCARDGSHGAGSKWERGVAALPLDTAFVWWAWMAGAGGVRGYVEDVARCWGRELRRKLPGDVGRWALRDFPVVDLVERLEERLSTLVALRGRQLWEEKTGGAGWDAIESLEDDEAKMWVECPWCGKGCELYLLTTARTGFCNAAFTATCSSSSCGRIINRETLGISRLLEDCLDECPAPREQVPATEMWEMDWEKGRRDEEDKVGRKLVAGTLSASMSMLSSTPTFSSRDLVSAALTTQDIQRVVRPLGDLHGRLKDRVSKLDKVARALFTDGALPAKIIRHVLSCYTTPHPFASDLALGAVRLSAFLDALSTVGCLAPGFAHSVLGREVLEKAEKRYELFLSVVDKVVKDGPAIVPLDIDFVWITHALVASQYWPNIVDHAGVLLDRCAASPPPLAPPHADFDGYLEQHVPGGRQSFHLPLSFVHSAPTSRNPLKRLLHLPPSSSLSPLSTHPVPASTAPSTHCSILVHLDKQAARRRKRREGESGAFLRGSASGKAGREEKVEQGEDVWIVAEEDAKRAGSAILGVDGFLAPTALLGFVHPRTYTPFRAALGSGDGESDEAGEREARYARRVGDTVRLFPGR